MVRYRRITPAATATLLGISLFLLAFLVYPLIFILQKSFIEGGAVTLHYFSLLAGSSHHWLYVLNSFNVAIAVTVMVTLIAVPMAVLFTRHRIFGDSLWRKLVILPLIVPPFVGALGVRQIFGRFGSLNLLLMKFSIIEAPVDWLGSSNAMGVILLQALHLFPLMYLTVSASLAAADTALEEAAESIGATPWQSLKGIVLPLAFPGYFASALLVFISSFTDLGTPLIFEYRQVVPVQIFNLLSDARENPLGYSLIVFIATLSILLFFLSQASVEGMHFAGSPRGFRSRLKRPVSKIFQIVALTFFLGTMGLSLLPHLGVLLVALGDKWFMTILPESYTLTHFREVFAHPLTSRSFLNSLLLSAGSVLITTLLGLTISYFLLRTKIPGRWILEGAVILPLAVPGLVIAFGYLGAFADTFLDPRKNPAPLLVIAYAIRRLPLMVRSINAGFQQASVTLEEAALSVGATRVQAMRYITIPLIANQVIAGALLVFAFSMLEVSDSLLLAREERSYPISKALYALTSRPDGASIACALAILTTILILSCLFVSIRLTASREGPLPRIS